MKIALITDGITPYVVGGMQRHSFYLAKYLAKNKISVDLFHFNQSDLDIEKLEVFNESEKQYIQSVVVPFPQSGKYPGHYIYESYRYSEFIFEQIKSSLNSYDFIYTKGFSGWKLINEKSKGLKCPPIGTNFHGYEMYQPAPSIKSIPSLHLLKYFTKPLLNKSDVVFSYGGKITDLLIHKIKISKQKIIEIPGGVETSWLINDSKKTNSITKFIFVGRAERRKGIEELNKVLNTLKDKESFHFSFIGNIPETLKIHHPNIHYLGEIRDSAIIKKHLQEHDVLVCPSHSEGMPNVILEGMASGCAIIASDVGAISKMVNKNNGWLIPPADIEQLKTSIEKAIHSNKNELSIKQKNSIQLVESTFLWDKIIFEFIHKISSLQNL